MKKNLPLVVGIALPVVFVIVISIVLFVPSFFIKPQHDFLYTTDEREYYYNYNPEYQNTYEVENGSIVVVPNTVNSNSNSNSDSDIPLKGETPTLYRYDIETNTSHQITLEEAKNLSLDPGPSSPDGYAVSYHYGHDGIFELFGSDNDNNGHYISKGNARKRLATLSGDTYRSYGYFKLIGWIK
jgi:hypothetical protein